MERFSEFALIKGLKQFCRAGRADSHQIDL
jgi:hypothetical protein